VLGNQSKVLSVQKRKVVVKKVLMEKGDVVERGKGDDGVEEVKGMM
jgi:hypothetical protein